ncbi:hypothetical protein [Ornithinimicrobium sufpigmenti]|uniref:hypothetical protein n=1 Tax=Ornithinimicrobium sufpigmenti TaxID=2508882 RepID=UPI001EDFAFDC|nr:MULTISPECIES: hypothetical protein [unclassified Ornithinimicrobium]
MRRSRPARAAGAVADVAVAAVREWARARSEAGVEEVRFLLLSQPVLSEFERALATTGPIP